MITERDIKILTFVNQFGFSTTSMVQELLFQNTNTRSARVITRRRLKYLYDLGLLRSFRKNIGVEDRFALTSKGIELIEDNGKEGLPRIVFQSWTTYNHDLEIQKAYLRFRSLGYNRLYPDRRSRIEKPFGELFPDLVIFRNDESMVAVEVEFTQKSKKRLEDKLKLYRDCAHELTVLYLCSNSSMTRTYQKLNIDGLKFYALDLQQFYNPTNDHFIHELMTGDSR